MENIQLAEISPNLDSEGNVIDGADKITKEEAAFATLIAAGNVTRQESYEQESGEITQKIYELLDSDNYQRLQEYFSAIQEISQNIRIQMNKIPQTKEIRNAIDTLAPLSPFILEEIHNIKENPEYYEFFSETDNGAMFVYGHDPRNFKTGYTEYDFFWSILTSNEKEIEINSPLRELLRRAISKKEEVEKAKNAVDIIKEAAEKENSKPQSKTEKAIEIVKQAAAELPKLQSLIPTQHTMPNNTLMNSLAGVKGKQPINAGAYDLPVIPATKRQKEITVYVMANYEPEKGIVSNLTEYERDVSDAIMSIWEQAQKEGKPAAFTTDSLYRAMPGRGKRASPQQKGAITKATEKFLHLYLEIDATDELRKRGVIGAGDTYHVKDYYLRAQEHIYKAKGGQPVRAWLMTGEPLILSYAKLTGQILTVPAEYLSIEKVENGRTSGELITMNASRQAMTSYMLRRIAVMKYDVKRAKESMRNYNRRRAKDKTLEELPLAEFRNQSDIILFDSLFKATETANTSREVTRRNREFCFDVLDYWTVSGYIKGYKKQSKGNNISGVQIECI